MTRNFFFATAITISGFMNAQNSETKPEENSESKFTLGVKGGYSLSSMKFFDNKLDSKSYFYAGIFGEMNLSEKVALQAELLYSEIGGKENFALSPITEDGYDPLLSNSQTVGFDYKFSQIQIPVSVKYYFVPKFSTTVGMNFGLNLSKKLKTDVIVNNTDSQDLQGYKTLNLFPFLSAEYKLTNQLFVDARYNFNFFDTHKNGFTTKIGFLQAGVGYRFN